MEDQELSAVQTLHLGAPKEIDTTRGSDPFELDDGDDEQGLLDWDQYQKMRHYYFCGMDCTWLVNVLPCLPFVPPEWWYRIGGTARRSLILLAFCLAFTILVLIIGLVAAGVAAQSPNKSPAPPAHPSAAASPSPPQTPAPGRAPAKPQSSPSPAVEAPASQSPVISLIDIAPSPSDVGKPNDHVDTKNTLPPTPSPEDVYCAWSEYRLPPHVVPHRYDLRITMKQPGYQEEDQWMVYGEVDIFVQVKQSTRCIVLHKGSQMEIKDVKISENQGNEVDDKHLDGQLIVLFEEIVKAGPQTIELFFQYPLNDGLVGFYGTNYTDDKGNVRFVAATFFEPLFARHAFPCFDEPNLKATFNVTISAPPNLTILSNMPKSGANVSMDLADGNQVVNFQDTPKLSTYTVAWLVGDLTSSSESSDTYPTITVWGADSRKNELDWAVSEANKILEVLQEMFGQLQQMPKIDLAAIPDFQAGAMENWGLLTFRESDLLIDSATAVTEDYERTSRVVAHELVHQWCGNMVTPDWWNDLWLSEGFATYFEAAVVHKLHPQFGTLTDFFTDSVLPAMHMDELSTSHRVTPFPSDIATDDMVDGLFDPITYDKGATILRQVRYRMAIVENVDTTGLRRLLHTPKDLAAPSAAMAWLPNTPLQSSRARGLLKHGSAVTKHDLFMSGLKMYLKAHQFQSTTTEHFWQAQQSASSRNVQEMGEALLKVKGFPLLVVEKLADGLSVKQVPVYDGGIQECDQSKTQPVWLQTWTGAGNKPSTIQELNSCAPERINLPHSPILLLNPGRIMYYRTDYGPQWIEVAETTGASSGADYISAVDMAGLLDDTFFLAKHANTNGNGERAKTFMTLVDNLAKRSSAEEVQLAPWRVVIQRSRQLLRVMRDSPNGCEKEYSQHILENVLTPYLESSVVFFGGSKGATGSKTRAKAVQALSGAIQKWGTGIDQDEQHVRTLALMRELLDFCVDLDDAAVTAAARHALQVRKDAWKVDKVHQWAPLLRAGLAASDDQQDFKADDVFKHVRSLYVAGQAAALEEQLLMAMFGVHQEGLAKMARNLATSDKMKIQDIPQALGSLAAAGGKVQSDTWHFVANRMDALMELSGEATELEQKRFALRVAASVGRYFSKLDGQNQLKGLLADYGVGEGDENIPRDLLLAIDEVGGNIMVLTEVVPWVCEQVKGQEKSGG